MRDRAVAVPALPLARQLALVEAVDTPGTRARTVTRVLALALNRPLAEVRTMTMSARAQALVDLALTFGAWPAWFVLTCRTCGAAADVSVSRSDFAADPAAWPDTVQTHVVDGQPTRFAALTGHHEEAISRVTEVSAARLLKSAVVRGARTAAAPRIEALAAADAEPILAALAPADPPPGVLPLACPSCGADVSFRFDPLEWIARHASESVREVATLARAYGWSEPEVCRLGPVRRSIYLRRAREMAA